MNKFDHVDYLAMICFSICSLYWMCCTAYVSFMVLRPEKTSKEKEAFNISALTSTYSIAVSILVIWVGFVIKLALNLNSGLIVWIGLILLMTCSAIGGFLQFRIEIKAFSVFTLLVAFSLVPYVSDLFTR